MNYSKHFRLALRAGIIGLGFVAGAPAVAAPAAGSAVGADVLYHRNCSVCHGDRGDGASMAARSLNPPPRDLTKVTELPRDYLINVIANGKPNTAMAGYKSRLNEEQIAQLADYIQANILNRGAAIAGGQVSGVSGVSGTLSAEERRTAVAGRPGAIQAPGAATAPAPAQPPAAATNAPVPPIAAPLPERAPVAAGEKADMSLPMPSNLVGNAAKGKPFFDANCAECHGVKGDGQGPRAYFIRPVPRNFMDERSRATLNRPAIYAATYFGRAGTEMPAWSKVISEQEIADVSEYVFQQFIVTAPKAAAKAK